MAEKRTYSISDEERQRRSERLAEQNRERARLRREARERGEELPATRPDPEPIDFDEAWEAKLRSILENPKATPDQILKAESAIERREKARRERQRSDDRREQLFKVALESHRRSAPPFEQQVARWRATAAEHGFDLKLRPLEETVDGVAYVERPCVSCGATMTVAASALEVSREGEWPLCARCIADRKREAEEPEPEPDEIPVEAVEELEPAPQEPAPEPRGNVVRWPVPAGQDPYAGLGPIGAGAPKGTAASGGYRSVDPTLGAKPY